MKMWGGGGKEKKKRKKKRNRARVGEGMRYQNTAMYANNQWSCTRVWTARNQNICLDALVADLLVIDLNYLKALEFGV